MTDQPIKLALLVGINYIDTSSELSGCINDVENTAEILTSIYNYDQSNIVTLTDNTEIKPTGNNIVTEIISLAEQSYKKNISDIWISYSGHGAYISDNNNDENDKRDECLVPLDYVENGLITDDILNHALGLINPKTKVVVVIDACHSETMLDLKYRYISGKKNVIENENCKVASNCIMISGCQDPDYSSDAFDINNSKEFSGAMTTSLLTVLKNFDYSITCWRLLKEMRRFLKRRKFSQIPQITCTNKLTCATIFSCVDPKPFITN